jgi:hypothetical protein
LGKEGKFQLIYLYFPCSDDDINEKHSKEIETLKNFFYTDKINFKSLRWNDVINTLWNCVKNDDKKYASYLEYASYLAERYWKS